MAMNQLRLSALARARHVDHRRERTQITRPARVAVSG
jgi:hypothetical protein